MTARLPSFTSSLPSAGGATFLFTDIEGSTKLWEAYPEKMRDSLARHDALMREAIGEAGGVVFKTIGDAFCAVFPTAEGALAAAVAGQGALRRATWPEDTVIRARMALHTGPSQERDGDYFGPVLNRISRLLTAGHGGQTLLSGTTESLVRGFLPSGTTLRDLGLRRLKDLMRPEHVFQLVHPDLPDSFPPLRTLEAIPNNLTQQVTRFIGREKEIKAVRALLANTRLLTLVGTGGTGKTRLALQIAAEALDEYPEGVWLVELASLLDPVLAPQAVAQVLGIRDQTGKEVTVSLTEHLRGKKLLLLMDNCEHLLVACARLTAALLRVCPDLRVIATSREPLGIAGEQAYRVPSLSVPEPGETVRTAESSMRSGEAVWLFLERAREVKPDFKVSERNESVLAQICRRLDGIPLALELAAARVRALSLEQINDRLDNRFSLLTGGDRTALPRQQTLRALVDWSFDLLTDPEKVLLARLSVFSGGWRLSAAEEICGFEPIEGRQVLDLLTSLVDKSLVLAGDDADERGEPRYRMLETLRQYGAEKRDILGETRTVRQCHLRSFTLLAEEAEVKLRGPEQIPWLNRLEAEYDNLRAALAFAGDAPKREEAVLGLRLAGALWRFWDVRGSLTEGREQTGRILEHGQIKGHEEEPLQRIRAKTLNGAGLLALSQGDYVSAQELMDEARTLFCASGDTSGIARVLNSLGNLAYLQGSFDGARSYYEASLTLRRASGATDDITAGLNNLGNLSVVQGNFSVARSRYEECLASFRKSGNKCGAADALYNLGSTAIKKGDFASAYPHLEECLSLYREIGNRVGVANTLNFLGSLYQRQGHLSAARSFLDESISLYREQGDRRGIANLLNTQGVLALNQGDLSAAWSLYSESLSLCRSAGNEIGIINALEGLMSVSSLREGHTAALVWGACDAARERMQMPLMPGDSAEYTKSLKQTRSTLGEVGFCSAWNEGRSLSLEEAIKVGMTTEI